MKDLAENQCTIPALVAGLLDRVDDDAGDYGDGAAWVCALAPVVCVWRNGIEGRTRRPRVECMELALHRSQHLVLPF